MEISTVEAAVCMKALQLAARAERRAGDVEMADAFQALRAQLWEKYKAAHPSPMSFDAIDAAGFDGTGRFEGPGDVVPRTGRGSVEVEGTID